MEDKQEQSGSGGSAPSVELARAKIPVELEGLDEVRKQIADLKQQIEELKESAAAIKFGSAPGEQKQSGAFSYEKVKDEQTGEVKAKVTGGFDVIERIRNEEPTRQMIDLLTEIRDSINNQHTRE